MRGVDVVILKLYIGSGAIRQNLHIFQKNGEGGLTFKTTIVLPAKQSAISLIGDRLIIKCQGREMAILTRDFFSLYIPPSSDYPEEN